MKFDQTNRGTKDIRQRGRPSVESQGRAARHQGIETRNMQKYLVLNQGYMPNECLVTGCVAGSRRWFVTVSKGGPRGPCLLRWFFLALARFLSIRNQIDIKMLEKTEKPRHTADLKEGQAFLSLLPCPPLAPTNFMLPEHAVYKPLSHYCVYFSKLFMKRQQNNPLLIIQ